MPYNSYNDLPERVRDILPKHAQEIYMKAFNNAWEEYKEAKARREGRSREETAHAVAWSAVEKSYNRDSQGRWQERD